MGQISVPGPYSGKSYPIIIAGNIPTDEEYGRISEYIRTQEAAVKADLEGKYGAENIDAPDDGTAIRLLGNYSKPRGKNQVLLH